MAYSGGAEGLGHQFGQGTFASTINADGEEIFCRLRNHTLWLDTLNKRLVIAD
jgi:hypothetical protein